MTIEMLLLSTQKIIAEVTHSHPKTMAISQSHEDSPKLSHCSTWINIGHCPQLQGLVLPAPGDGKPHQMACRPSPVHCHSYNIAL